MATTTDAPSSTTPSGSFSVKLIIDTKQRKVLCAEAGKDFVDFLFNFLTMPIGTIARLLKEAPGCVGEMAAGIEAMDQTCFQSGESRDFLVTKLRGETHVKTVPLIPVDPDRSMNRTVYSCWANNHRVTTCGVRSEYTDSSTGICSFGTTVHFKDAYGWCREADFVKGALRYYVRDDLTVSPIEYSMIAGATVLMTEFGVKDFGLIEERVVRVGINEGLELLRAFMHTKSALTTVFLGKEDKDAIVKKESI